MVLDAAEIMAMIAKARILPMAMYALPVMFIAMGVGISGMFGTGASQELSVYCIPLYNTAGAAYGEFDVAPVEFIACG